MFLIRRSGAAFGALLLLAIASCTDSSVVQPTVEQGSDAQLSIFDGTTFGSDDFYFLPPTVPTSPDILGEFNPDLAPSVRICELDGGPVPSSVCVATIEEIPTSAIEILENSYRLDWDPKGENTGRVNSKRYYRAQVIVADSVFGYIDLDPVGNGDIETDSDFDPTVYALQFRPRSQTVPIEFFLSVTTFCTGESFVTECITGVAVNQEGANVTLDDEGNRLGVIISQNSLPAPLDQITVTLERIDPVAFFATTGEECIPGVNGIGLAQGDFDAPQFGDCFRVRTFPTLTDPLVADAVVSICLDISELNLSLQQIEQIRMVKFNDTSNDNWAALEETAGDCPVQQASLFDVPDSGFMRYAAMGANAFASFVGPQPVEARSIRFGGFNSSFSRFRFALPGQMIPTVGDGAIVQPTDDNTIAATIQVLDAGDDDGLNREPVAGARVRFAPATDAGTVSAPEAITDEFGNATVQWTVDRTVPGDKTLTASALGLFSGPVPDPDGVQYDFVAESVTFTATVVGPPSELDQEPADNIDDAVAGVPQSLTVIVADAGSNAVQGATVTWTCTPTCTFGEGTQNEDGSATTTSQSNGSGQATIQWTPLTAGSQVSVASVDFEGVPDATFTATVAPAAAVAPTYPTPPETATAGLTLVESLVITVEDEFGNPRIGDVVTWTVGPNSGSVSQTETTVAADGTAQVDWTLGQAVGINTLTVAVGGTAFSEVLSVTGEAGAPVQPTGTPVASQSGTVATALSTALTVTVVDQFGNPVSGETVSWSTTDAGASFSPESAATDAAGQVSTSWTLGTVSGAQAATATMGDFTVGFTADAAPGAPSALAGAGGGVTQVVGTTVDLTATVTDVFGNLVPGAEVTWGGDGTFSSPTSLSGTDGVAAVTWTLTTLAGGQSATGSLGELTPASYTATATPSAASALEQSGAGDEYDRGTALPLSITVRDEFGNTRDGDAVSWSTTSGSVPGDAATANGGIANATWTLGDEPGDYTASAMVGGLTATFTARVKGCIVDVNGVVEEGEWDCALEDGTAESFTANVDGGVPAEVRWQQRADSIFFLVRVQQVPLDRVNEVRIDFDNTLNGATSDDDAIGYSTVDGFYDDYLTQQCVNRGQSGCGATDSNGQDGSGAQGDDGTWTVYELSHPLNGDGVQDIAATVPGSQFGFFLTFQNGNGAKGNTQFPGFRSFQIVTIE